jgi:hypothetical protein
MAGRGGKYALAAAATLCGLLLVLVAAAPAKAAPRCTIVGTAGPDTLRGKNGPDVICGRRGADRIVGAGGADRIVGGPGADRLFGGAGRDALHGGPGSDSCRDSAATVFAGCERVRPGRKLRRPWPAVSPWPGQIERLDREAPTAVFVWFQKRFVDTSLGDATVGLHLEAWDESGIGSISIQIDGPAGAWKTVQLEGGPDPLAMLDHSLEVPASTPAGDYRLASLTISDKKGNARTLSGAELASYRAELAVFEGPDVEPPELSALSLSASEVDTSIGPATVDLFVGATDALSGVNDVYVTLRLPNWEPGPVDISSSMGPEVPPDSGTRHDGVWTQSLSLVQHAMPGTYEIGAVFLSDLAGNTTRYTQAELEELGYPVEFVQTGAGDTTPPEIVDLWFEPSQLQTSAGARTIVFYTHARDDLTGFGQFPNEGFSRISTDFEPPGDWGEFSTSGGGPQLVSGTELDGVWRQVVVLEPNSPAGVYELTYAAATDRAGNALLLKRADIEAAGWPSSFVNVP